MPEKTILIVDDEPIWLKLLSRLFKYHGYAVLAASSCAEGLDKLRESDIDCALLDFNLGDGCGAVICAAIREKDAGPKTPVIIFSADPAAEACLTGTHRADLVIFKDTSISELPVALARLF
jgi:two-component system OmpR family response regulator